MPPVKGSKPGAKSLNSGLRHPLREEKREMTEAICNFRRL
jgi:hypothetical protein